MITLSSVNKLLLLVSIAIAPILINTFSIFNNTDNVVFLNIGQGNGTLVCNSYRHCGLIDTGKQISIIQSIKNYTSYPLEFLILTHADLDHIAETIPIINEIGAKKLFFSYTNKSKELIDQVLSTNKTDIYQLKDNDDFKFGSYKFDLLWPTNTLDLNLLESNDTSSTIYITNNKSSFYIAGDLSTKFEEFIADKYKISNITISQLSHHGSKNSSSKYFLSKTSPSLAIISVGKNTYGHPSKEAIQNLEDLNIKYLRTDSSGDIKVDIFSDKAEINTQNSKKSYIILN